ncbi:MAG: plastocyanin/azurin family copper-binding protein [Verrucomicrobiota bacterium]
MNFTTKPYWLVAAIPLLPISSVAFAKDAKQQTASQTAATKVEIKVIPNLVKFDVVRFDAIAGAPVVLNFSNDCIMPHNLVLIKPDAEPALIAGVNALGLEGMDKGFVPDVPGIIAASKLLQPHGKQEMTFQAPEEPGDYPFMCTFPGHWYTMRGVMHVLKKGESASATVKDTEKVVNVADAAKDSGVHPKPMGTMEKPLVMRSFVQDPGLDDAVFAHHGRSKDAVKYSPETRLDIPDQPVIARPGIVGAIAVSHGPEFSYVYDTTECRFLYAWRGGFLDMTPYWGKGTGAGRSSVYTPWIIGGIVYRTTGKDPISGNVADKPEFGGYRMVNGAPEFWYRLGKRVVRQLVHPKASGGFEIAVQVEGEGAPLTWTVNEKDTGFVKVTPGSAGKFTVSVTDRPEPTMPEYVPPANPKKKPDPAAKPAPAAEKHAE